MIRINLLPVKAARKREYGRQQLVLLLFVILLEGVVLYMVQRTKQDELDEISRTVEETRAQIAQVQEFESRIASLEAQKSDLVSVRTMLEDLQANRIGPGGPLEELKAVLNGWTTDRERAEQDARGWDTQVDPRRVWLDSLSIDSTGFRLRGNARVGEDVAEFLHRLETNRPGQDPFFVRPDLSSYSRQTDTYFGEVMVFAISGGVRYHPMALGTN